VIDYRSNPTPTAKKTGGNPLMAIISGILAVALIAVGVLYVMEMSKLNKANENVTSLEGQLATEKASVTSLQTQLDAAKADAANLQAQLSASKSDLAAVQSKVTSLTADLAAANTKVTTTQTSLDKANADLALANTSLKKVQDPRTFNTIQELTTWLQKDDTNTNSQYASYTLLQKAYMLQIKASRDGFLLTVWMDTDGAYFYVLCEAIIGNSMYDIDVATDQTTLYMSGFTPMPSHPLPLP